jgi:hypothetical protein
MYGNIGFIIFGLTIYLLSLRRSPFKAGLPCAFWQKKANQAKARRRGKTSARLLHCRAKARPKKIFSAERNTV